MHHLVFKPIVGIVTYYPNEATCERIEDLVSKGVSILVYDNTPGDNFWPHNLSEFIIRTGQNCGLGIALKCIGKAAFQKGFSHLLYFDEDIIFDYGTLDWINRWFNYHRPSEQVGLIWFNYTFRGFNSPENSTAYPIKIAVSASSLVNLKAASDIGWHTDKWFLEGIDYDFCFRLVQGGYKLLGVDHCPGIDPVANQPGIRRIDSKGNKMAVRIQPMKRLWNFWYALLHLTLRALWKGPRSYAYLFFRNIFTYAYDQISAIFWTYRIRLWKK